MLILSCVKLAPYCPELNDIERIWKYVKAASLANYDFGHVTSICQAIAEVFDEINSNSQSDLALHFRDPLSKYLLQGSLDLLIDKEELIASYRMTIIITGLFEMILPNSVLNTKCLVP